MTERNTPNVAYKKAVVPIALSLLFAAGLALGRYWDDIRLKRPYGDRTKLEQVMQLVQEQYVDSLSPDDLEHKSINYFLHALDPHSVYIPASEVVTANQDLQGSFDGIGLEFFMLNDTPCVSRVIPGGSASEMGLRPADRLLAADSLPLIGLSTDDIISRIKGKRNTNVVLDVHRPSVDEHLQIRVNRIQIQLPTVSWLKINDSTAYLRVAHFARPTHDEFANAWQQLNSGSPVTQLIMDLRDNPGGYLQVAVDLLDEFIDGEKTLAFTLGKGKYRSTYRSTKGGLCTDVKLICLVNERSASASEIFSGAIQDLDRGLVIGSNTFGKGLVQETFRLRDDSEIRLTVSRYYIPSGRSIQKPYAETGYLNQVGTKSTGDTFRTAHGRLVYARGGIQPDILLKEPEAANWNTVTIELIRFIDENYQLVNSLTSPEAFWASRELQNAVKRIAKDLPISPDAFITAIAYQFLGDSALLEEPGFERYLQKILGYFKRIERLLNP